MYVSANIDIADVMAELTDDEVQELYDDRFSSHSSNQIWMELYEKRCVMTTAEFLMHLDVIIMDKTGRIL
jgi:hypothetical protein